MNSESVSTQTFSDFQNSQNILSVYFALYSILHWTFLKYFFSILSKKKKKLVGIRMKFPLWSLGGHLQSQLECRAVKSSLLLEVTNYLINLSDQTKAFFFFLSHQAGSVGRHWPWAGRRRASSSSAAVELTANCFYFRFHTRANVLILAQRRQTCQYSCVLWFWLFICFTNRKIFIGLLSCDFF